MVTDDIILKYFSDIQTNSNLLNITPMERSCSHFYKKLFIFQSFL